MGPGQLLWFPNGLHRPYGRGGPLGGGQLGGGGQNRQGAPGLGVVGLRLQVGLQGGWVDMGVSENGG